MAQRKIRSCTLYNQIQNERITRPTDPEGLIELVKANGALYDRKQPTWYNKWYKGKVWKQIGQQLGRSGRSCKLDWTYICDQYKKNLVSRAEGYQVKEYKHSEQLKFLEYDVEKLLQKKIKQKLRANKVIEERKEVDKSKPFEYCNRKKQKQKSRATRPKRRRPEFLRKIDDAELVKLVKSHCVLYDKSHCRWKDHVYKTEIWKQIGLELDRPFLQCRRRWYAILYGYKSYLKRKANKTNTGHKNAKKIHSCCYSHMLGFLGLESKDALNESIFKIKNERLTGSDTEESSTGRIKSPSIEETCIKFEKEEPESYIEKLINTKSVVEINPIDSFLSGISPTLKSLTPDYWMLAQTRINSLVQEYINQNSDRKNFTEFRCGRTNKKDSERPGRHSGRNGQQNPRY